MAGAFFSSRATRPWRVSAWAMLAVLALVCAVAERSATTLPFTLLSALVAVCALLALTARPVLSLALVAALSTVLAFASHTKSQMMAMTLHAYDFVYFARTPTELVFMARHYPDHVTQAAVALLATVIAGAALLWFEPPRIPRKRAAQGLALAFVGAAGLYNAAGAPDVSYFFRGRHLLSSFFASIPEAAGVMRQGGFFSGSARAGAGDAIRPGLFCPPGRDYPSMVLTLNESAFSPGQFRQLAHDPALLDHFRSEDGAIHKLGVETFGGGTWLTEFNVLTGLSTWPMGNVRTYLGRLLEGRVKHALPSYLKACGYETLALYPAAGDFVNSRVFYASLGFDRFEDARDMGAKVHERDSFYFARAVAAMREQFAKSDKPLFVFIITSATHFPYDWRLSPDDDTEAGGEANSPEFNEYLRRLALGQKDWNAFRAELAAAFAGRRFVLAHFGDHLPFIAGALRNDVPEGDIGAGAPDRKRFPDLYETYFKFEGLGMKLAPTPAFARLDVPYLSTLLLEAAGLPLDDAFRARARLMRQCDGRMDGCPAAEAVGRLYRGLIDAGLLIDR